MAAVPTTPAELSSVLDATLDGRTANQAAEVILAFMQSWTCIPALANAVLTCENPGSRQQAANLLRKGIGEHWYNVPVDARPEIRNQILHAACADPTRPVRYMLTFVIVRIARYSLEKNDWPEFFPIMHEGAVSENVHHRELCFTTLSQLIDLIDAKARGFFAELAPLLCTGLQDPSPNVQYSSFCGVISIAVAAQSKSEVDNFIPVMPELLGVIMRLIQGNEDAKALACLSVFEDMVEGSAPVLMETMGAVIELMMVVSRNKELDQSLRIKGPEFFMQLVSQKPALVVKAGYQDAFLDLTYYLLQEGQPLEETAFFTLFSTGCYLLDRLCLKLAPKYTFRRSMERAAELMNSSEGADRRAGLVIVGMLSEGCQEEMKPLLNDIINMVDMGAADPDPQVRDGAATALALCSDFLRPDIQNFHQRVLEGACKLIQEPAESTKQNSVKIIANLVEFLGTTAKPYAELLLTQLFHVLNHGTREIQGMVCTAIGCVANSCQSDFLPFYNDTMNALMTFMQLTEDENLQLRARATEAVGSVAGAVGYDIFQPHLHGVMEVAMQGLNLEYWELREFTYSFFAKIASMMKERFEEYMPHVVPLLIKVLQASEVALFAGNIDDASNDSEDPDYITPPGVIDEKGAASCCIGLIAENCGSAFFPYVQEATGALIALCQCDDYEVRATVMTSLKQVCMNVGRTFPSPQWVPGLPVKEPVDEHTSAVLEVSVNEMMKIAADDADHEPVSRALECLVELCKAFGPIVLSGDNSDETFCRLAELIMSKQHACQQPPSDDGEDLEDEAPIDLSILETDTICEAVETVSQVLGPSFEPLYKELAPHLIHRMKPNRTVWERTCSAGVLAVCTDSIGPLCEPYVQDVLPHVLAGLRDEEEEVVRNCAYCVGMIVKALGPASAGYFPHILVAMAPVFQRQFNDGATMDNACSAIARMILADPSQLPLSQLLPPFLAQLPLKKDVVENPPVYQSLFSLFRASNGDIFSQLPAVVRILGEAFASNALQPEIVEEAVALLKSLGDAPEVAGAFRGAVESAGEPARSALLAALSS